MCFGESDLISSASESASHGQEDVWRSLGFDLGVCICRRWKAERRMCGQSLSKKETPNMRNILFFFFLGTA